MKKYSFLCAMLLMFLLSTTAHAASTSAGVSVGRGQADSMVYSLQINQHYEPWLTNSVLELSPLAEIGAHLWVPDDNDADNVWGAYLAPGLRLSLFTTQNFTPFLEGSFGGAINSKRRLDNRNLGSHALFRTRGSVGVAFGSESRHRLQGDYIHYSNFGLANHNAGYSTYGISYGYSF